MAGEIRGLVDASDLLKSQEHYNSALIQLLIAIAASSTKMFPAGTSSIENPAKKPGRFNEMGDGEKFRRFLGPILERLMFGSTLTPGHSEHWRPFRISESNLPLEEFLYKQFRNSVIHEGKLPPGFSFGPNAKNEDGFLISFGGEGIKFNRGLLNLLRAAVVNAPINAKEFGLTHYHTIPKDGSSLTDLAESLAKAYQTTPGRIIALMEICCDMGPECVTATDDRLNEMVKKSRSFLAARVGLQNNYGGPDIYDSIFRRLTAHGLKTLRAVIDSVEIQDIGT